MTDFSADLSKLPPLKNGESFTINTSVTLHEDGSIHSAEMSAAVPVDDVEVIIPLDVRTERQS